MIIASGTSTGHVGGLTTNLQKFFSNLGYKAINIEGKSQCEWIAVDLIDAVVHIFCPEKRDIYQLEKMWSVPNKRAAEAKI